MKFLQCIFISFLCNGLIAQINIPEPEYSGRPYYLKDGKLENLEKADATIDIKVKGMGYGGTDQFYTAFQSVSSIQFNYNNIPHFYIKLEGPGDPSDKVTVCIAEVKKDRRRFKTASRKMMGASRDVDNVNVNLDVKRVRDNLYEVIFNSPLKAGQYAFMPTMDMNSMMSGGGKMHLFCFGVMGEDGNNMGNTSDYNGGPRDPLGHAIYKKIHEGDAPPAQNQNNTSNDNISNSAPEQNKPTPLPSPVNTTTAPTPVTQPTLTPTQVPVAAASTPVTFSPADEIMKWKKLLDAGAITQQEFDAQKKKILSQ